MFSRRGRHCIMEQVFIYIYITRWRKKKGIVVEGNAERKRWGAWDCGMGLIGKYTRWCGGVGGGMSGLLAHTLEPSSVENFPADSEDVADECGDDQNYRRRRQVPAGWTRSMNGRLFVTYSQQDKKRKKERKINRETRAEEEEKRRRSSLRVGGSFFNKAMWQKRTFLGRPIYNDSLFLRCILAPRGFSDVSSWPLSGPNRL